MTIITFWWLIYSYFFFLGRCADDKPFVPIYQVSKEKTKSLGIDYVPTKIGVKETIDSLKEKGFVNF